MPLSARQLLSALGEGQTMADIAAAAGVSVDQVEQLWKSALHQTLPPGNAKLTGSVANAVEIIRDSYGVPHVYAENERDVFYGLGFAMAQDRLWQMDYMRRKATGRLAELLGPSYLEQDYMYRTLDFPTVCARNYGLMDERWRHVLDGMSDGINRAIAQAGDHLPIEFDILGYRPEPWSPIDILVGLRYQWWGLSGRLQQITSNTILERELGDELEAFQRVERPEFYIVPDGQNAGSTTGAVAPVRDTLYVSEQPHGSNNWVIAGQRTRSRKPLLANDPHYGYAHGHGLFYACHLSGGGHGEAGFVFIGTPGMMTGANGRVAWGFTNNGTTIRDLYAEEINPRDPSRYRKGSEWVPLAARLIDIKVKGQEPARRTIRSTAHGPIVNDVIPKTSENDPPLALRWVGFEMIDDVQSILQMNTATSWSEFRAALSNWACSVTNFIYADVNDNIGYQMSARIPLREISTRGFRPAWDPGHEWNGYVPFDGNPRIENPPDGVIATANNRPVNPNYQWPLYGGYAGGTRQERILDILRSKTDHDLSDFRRMQYDSKTLIAQDVTPRIVATVERSNDEKLGRIAKIFRGWDYCATVNAVAPTIFEMFMHEWTPVYSQAALADRSADVRAAAGQVARRALMGEENVLSDQQIDSLIVQTLRASLKKLTELFGPDPDTWTWGRAHHFSWPHPLGHIGQLGDLLNGPTLPCAGTLHTINHVAPSASHPFVATSGPTYRLIADLSNPNAVLINSHSPTSGHPASPHYSDTIRDWAQGNYQTLHRDRALVEIESEGRTTIEPAR